MKNLLIFQILLLLAITNSVFGQCPTTACASHITIISTDQFPDCPSNTLQLNGDIDNDGDCEDGNNDNCWKYIFNQHDPIVEGLTMEIGKGNGCNRQVNTFYTEIDGVCVDQGSSGSQNFFTFNFGINGQITMWLCDNSSGQVSLCDLCNEPLSPAPVDLVSFTGKAMEFTNDIRWATEKEEESALFVVQKSINGRSNFQTVGTLEAQGYSNEFKYYQLVDRNPFPITYYRLQSIDLDGSYEYSDWVAVRRDKAIQSEQLHVFPLPLAKNEALQVYYEATLNENIIVTINDIQGRKLFKDQRQLTKGMHNWSIELPSFAEGLLILKIHSTSGIRTHLIPRISE